jgi:hypothetical protein
MGRSTELHLHWIVHRVGQNRKYTPYMTVYLAISLPKMPYVHREYKWFCYVCIVRWRWIFHK